VYMYGCMNVKEVRDYVCRVYVWVYECERSSKLCAWCICMVYECERSSRLCVSCICMGI